MIGTVARIAGLGLALASVVAAWSATGPPTDDKELAAWVDARIQAWQPTAAERIFDQIGWAPTIIEAERLAKEHGRPMFLFTFDGPSMSLGRC